jgi:hypothetical protein
LAVVGPIVDGVVDLAVGPGHGTAGAGAAAIAGEQHDSLVGGGDAAGPTEVQCAAGVVVEDGQVVVGVAGHLDDGGHGQQAAGGGEGLSAAGFEFLQGGRDDDRGRRNSAPTTFGLRPTERKPETGHPITLGGRFRSSPWI